MHAAPLGFVPVLLVAWCAAALVPADARTQYGAADGEWRSYGGDAGSTKYSPLDQIDAGNFGDLQIAWRWQSADGSLDLDALRERVPRLWKWQLQKGPPRPRERTTQVSVNTSDFGPSWLSVPGLSGRACQDRARSRRQGRQPRAAGAERSDAP